MDVEARNYLRNRAKKLVDQLIHAKQCAHCNKAIQEKAWIQALNAVVCLLCGGSVTKMGQLPITFNQVKDPEISREYCGTLYANRWTIRKDSNVHRLSCHYCTPHYNTDLDRGATWYGLGTQLPDQLWQKTLAKNWTTILSHDPEWRLTVLWTPTRRRCAASAAAAMLSASEACLILRVAVYLLTLVSIRWPLALRVSRWTSPQ